MGTMSDDVIEQEIQAKGLNAPRLTPQDIESVIEYEYYVNAFEAVGSSGVSAVDSEEMPLVIDEALRVITVCFLKLRNGTTAIGDSACVSPENYDAEVGRKVARENAKSKIWKLEGYLLKQRLHERRPAC